MKKRPPKLNKDVDLEALFLEQANENEQLDDFGEMLEAYLENMTDKNLADSYPKTKWTFKHPPDEELDLHGLTREEALKKVDFFIENSRRWGLKIVRIITGKGLHSTSGPVLKDAVEERIVELKKSGMVSGFKWEKKKKRKSGAIVVIL